LLKSLKEIGFDQYYQAEQNGWVLYLEGATDFAILKAFAETLDHEAKVLLERPFVHYVQDQPNSARSHFRGLIEAKPDLLGFALFDRLNIPMMSTSELKEYMWGRYEIENYIFTKDTLLNYAESLGREKAAGPLFESEERGRLRNIMQECLEDLIPPAALRDPTDSWWIDTKASDFLERLFRTFFKNLGLPNLMNKSDYHILAPFVPKEQIDPEVIKILNMILKVGKKARPRMEEP